MKAATGSAGLPAVAEPLRDRFAGLAREQEAALLRAAARLCGYEDGGDRARDLVQETLVAAYEALLTGTPFPERPRAWLVTILTRRYINHYRRQRKWEAHTDMDQLTAGGDLAPVESLRAVPSSLPGGAMIASTLDEALETALLSLSAPLRACVLLVDIEGLEYAEAAEALDVPIGTVRSRLNRARLRLYGLLEEHARARRWLVNLHVARCPQCQSALKAMAEMVARLRAGNREEEAPSASAAGLGRERWAQMEAAWEQAENRHRPEAPPDR